MQTMTPEQIKELLKIYYDIPQMIAEEFATISNCENEKRKITLPSVNLSGMPGSTGAPGDRTANAALNDQSKYFDDEIKHCYKTIGELREQRNWLSVALNMLVQTDRYILELAYMGDPKKRRRAYRRPPWKEIASKVDYSKSQTRARLTAALFIMADFSSQQVLPEMIR